MPMSSEEIIELFPTPLVIDRSIVMDPEEYKFIMDLVSCHDNFKTQNRQMNLQYQTKDTDILRHLPKLREQIINAVKKFNDNIILTSDLVLMQSWINLNLPGSNHPQHVHPNSIVSGIFYIAAEKDSGNIRFWKNFSIGGLSIVDQPKAWGRYNFLSYYFEPKPNELFLFPGSLMHSVDTNKTTTERVSLSFNTFFSGSFGSEEDLSYIDLDKVKGKT